MKKIFILLSVNLLVCCVKAQLPDSISTADKIYGLSKFWQEVNYNFIYLNKIDKARWDSTYKHLLMTIQQTKNDYEYYREMQKFCALLRDGHTNVNFPKGKAFETMTTMFGEYRLFIENMDGKAIIVRTNLSKKSEVPFGSEVIEVNGKPVQKYIDDDVAPYISSSTDYVLQDWAINSMLKGLEGDKYTVRIKKPGGSTITLSLTHKKTDEKEVYPDFDTPRSLMDFKWQKNGIAYLSLNSFEDAKIDSLFIDKLPELYQAKALIIDLRYNGGGNTAIGTTILKYLTADTILYGSKNRSRLHIPSYKAWGKFIEASDTVNDAWAKKAYLSFRDNYYYNFEYEADTVRMNLKRLVVPTVILLGHNTASAAEDFLIYADNQKHMIKMGSNSFGSTGQPYMFDLPGGGTARVCTKQDTYPDGREFVGYGIRPDIEVKQTLNDYLQKKDACLERAIVQLQNKIK
jgi:C-terminal processing protease CtpA/Prc